MFLDQHADYTWMFMVKTMNEKCIKFENIFNSVFITEFTFQLKTMSIANQDIKSEDFFDRFIIGKHRRVQSNAQSSTHFDIQLGVQSDIQSKCHTDGQKLNKFLLFICLINPIAISFMNISS